MEQLGLTEPAEPRERDVYATVGVSDYAHLSLELIVFWFVIYAGVAISVAVITSAVTRHYRKTDSDNPVRWGSVAVLAGVLWPIILIGLAQLLILLVITRAPSILGSVGRLART